MKKNIVIGLGFGDEGKGLMTSYLVSKSLKPLVIRFNGGQQAGHTVSFNNKRHVFSNFGSGTLQNAPTYWSEFCTIDPLALFNEYNSLKNLGFLNPELIIDPLCMVTTPFDITANHIYESTKKHGSCGVGFGQTIKRNEDNYKLHAIDMLYPEILKEKLKNIMNYYNLINHNNIIENFLNYVKLLIHNSIIKIEKPNFIKYDELIFEGAQGVMLDMDFGFFPNVTRSNTTSKNAFTILKNNKLTTDDVEINYVSRVYQTRHGNGYMTNEDYPLHLKNNENETNVNNKYQGKFRIGALDINLLNYALMIDDTFSYNQKKNILFTCLDQVQSPTSISCSLNNVVRTMSLDGILSELKFEFNNIHTSYGPSYSNIVEFIPKLFF